MSDYRPFRPPKASLDEIAQNEANAGVFDATQDWAVDVEPTPSNVVALDGSDTPSSSRADFESNNPGLPPKGT